MNFQWNATKYERRSTAQWAKELLARIEFNGEEDVLDTDCGDGRITVLLAETWFGRLRLLTPKPDLIDWGATVPAAAAIAAVFPFRIGMITLAVEAAVTRIRYSTVIGF